MDLQFILMLIGASIVAIIVWDSWRRKGKNRNKKVRDTTGVAYESTKQSTVESVQIEPMLEHFIAEPAASVSVASEAIDLEAARQQFQAKAEQSEAQQSNDVKPVQRDIEKKTDLIVLFILAKQGKKFSGIDLFHQFERLYLHFGDMDIFHRHKSETGEGPVLFSIASALEPGVFDYNEPENFSTTGLTLFMQLPGHFSGSDAFETFLHTARLLTQRLDANLCDSKRQAVTTEALDKYRQIAQQYG